MRFIDKKNIIINRELSDLDRFTLDFIKVLEKHTQYVLVSGYVAILLGRARISEDVDVIIPKINVKTFDKLYRDIKNHNFYCLNTEESSDVFEYLEEGLAVRFAYEGTIIPNVELKWVKHRFDQLSFEKTITVNLGTDHLRISNLELQIAFKEEVLKSPKDLEDADHIREVAKTYLDDILIQKYKERLHEFYSGK